MTQAEIAMQKKNADDAVAFRVIGYGATQWLFDDNSYIQKNVDGSFELGKIEDQWIAIVK